MPRLGLILVASRVEVVHFLILSEIFELASDRLVIGDIERIVNLRTILHKEDQEGA